MHMLFNQFYQYKSINAFFNECNLRTQLIAFNNKIQLWIENLRKIFITKFWNFPGRSRTFRKLGLRKGKIKTLLWPIIQLFSFESHGVWSETPRPRARAKAAADQSSLVFRDESHPNGASHAINPWDLRTYLEICVPLINRFVILFVLSECLTCENFLFV